MKSFLATLQFLTLLPFGRTYEFEPRRMVPYFPAAGLFIGVLLACFDKLTGYIWPPQIVALLDTIFLVLISGALHLDGLGDTADGLYGGRTREKALTIMKDSRMGTMGVVAIILVLAIKWAAISHLNVDRLICLALVPGYARGAMLFGFSYLPYGRADEGTGHAFFQSRLTKADYLGICLIAVLSILAGWRGVLLNALFAVIIAATLSFYRKRIGCITGDMLGAMTEITEALLFLGAAAFQGL